MVRLHVQDVQRHGAIVSGTVARPHTGVVRLQMWNDDLGVGRVHFVVQRPEGLAVRGAVQGEGVILVDDLRLLGRDVQERLLARAEVLLVAVDRTAKVDGLEPFEYPFERARAVERIVGEIEIDVRHFVERSRNGPDRVVLQVQGGQLGKFGEQIRGQRLQPIGRQIERLEIVEIGQCADRREEVRGKVEHDGRLRELYVEVEEEIIGQPLARARHGGQVRRAHAGIRRRTSVG